MDSMGLYQLLREGVFTDAGIITSNKQFSAHKLILASESGYFRAAFTTMLDQKSYVHLPHIQGEIMDLLIDFMYLKNLDIDDNNACEIYIAADYLCIDAAIINCAKYLVSHVGAENCIQMLHFARFYNVPNLAKAAWQKILLHFEDIGTSSVFLELELNDLLEILKSNYLNVRNEEKVWELAVSWIQHEAGREAHTAEILACIRMGLMTTENFLTYVRDHPLVRDNESCVLILADAFRIFFDLDGAERNLLMTEEMARPRYPTEILFAVGGWSNGNPTNCIEAYDVKADRWSILTEMDPMGPRAYHGTAVINNEIYVIGGYNGFDYYNSCRCFNVENRTWREIAPMNKSRCYVSVAVSGDTIYAMGGYNGSRRQATAERYDSKTNQWTMIAEMHSARSDASASAIQDKIFIVGGFNGHECLSSVEMYDPSTNVWQFKESMESRRSGVSCILFHDQIYVMGGFNGTTRMASGEKYDPRRNRWTPVPPMQYARSNFAMSVIDGFIVAIGGFNGIRVTPDVESYNAEEEQWVTLNQMNVERSALAACTLANLPNVEDFVYHPPIELGGEENVIEVPPPSPLRRIDGPRRWFGRGP